MTATNDPVRAALASLIEVYDAMGAPRGPARIRAEAALDHSALPITQEARDLSGRSATGDVFDADSVRQAFERDFLNYFGRQPENAVFDRLGDHWLDRTEDGRYEVTRVDDAWTGWLAAARHYAHYEHLFRVAKLGHEQAFAECQRLAAIAAATAKASKAACNAQETGRSDVDSGSGHPSGTPLERHAGIAGSEVRAALTELVAAQEAQSAQRAMAMRYYMPHKVLAVDDRVERAWAAARAALANTDPGQQAGEGA